MSNLDPVALECLAAVIEEGGFEKAAVRLNVTQSAVSQRLRALEAQIGSVLVVRSRPLRPTAAGQLLLKHTQQLRLLRTDLEQELHSLLPHAMGRSAHDEAISIAINADGCRVTALGAMHYIAVASPAFAEQHVPQGINRSNFKHLPFLSYNRKDDMQRVFVARAMGLKTVGLHQLYVPNSEAQVRAVAAGWGVGVVPELLARPYLADGRLVNVAEAQVLRVDLFWHCWNLQSALLSALSDAMVHSAKGSLAPPTAAARATVKA